MNDIVKQNFDEAGNYITEMDSIDSVYVLLGDGGAMSVKSFSDELKKDPELLNCEFDKQWWAVAIEVNDDNNELFDDHTNERIPMSSESLVK